ncbi:MAG: 30S ribosomal protein S6 [Anaerolineales bacterium]
MRAYELVFIAHPDLEETAFNELVTKIQGWITEAGGSISKVDVWGKRKLAYPIRKQREGQYALIEAQMQAEFCAELERNLRFAESVIRYLLIAQN